MQFMHNTDAPLSLEQIARLAPSALAVAPHHSRSSKYCYVPTIDIIKHMMESGFQPFKATQSISRVDDKINFTKHMIRFRKLGDVNVGDTVPEIVLVNSHDGTSSYQLMGGLFCKVCTNGMVVSEGTIGMVRIPHSGNIIDQVIEGSYRIISDSDRALMAITHWSQLYLTSGEQVLFADAARVTRFGDPDGNVTTPITPQQLLAPRRAADTGSDLWRVFNRVQENVIRGGIRGYIEPHYDGNQRIPGRRFRTREIRSIDQDVKLNRALWTLAEKMAELKGGLPAHNVA